MHVESIIKGLEEELLVGSSLIDMYAKCGTLYQAQNVLKKLPSRKVVSWTALIAGYTKHGRGQEILNCFERMQLEGISPGGNCFTFSLKACLSMGTIGEGRDLHVGIVNYGFEKCPQVGNECVCKEWLNFGSAALV